MTMTDFDGGVGTETEVTPFRLKPWFSERVWGRRDLRPWYEETGTTELVGEAWLTGPDCVVETGELEGGDFKSVCRAGVCSRAGRQWGRRGVSATRQDAVSEREAVGAGASGRCARAGDGAAAGQDGGLVRVGGGAGRC